MMVPRRVVLLLHAERLLNPKKESEAAARDLEALEAYVKAPVDTAASCMVAESLDKRRSLTKLLLSKAAVVECAGPADAAEAARWVRDRVAQEGMTIDARAARLVADRVGPDIGAAAIGRRAADAVRGGQQGDHGSGRERGGRRGHVAGRLGGDAGHRERLGRQTRCASLALLMEAGPCPT